MAMLNNQMVFIKKNGIGFDISPDRSEPRPRWTTRITTCATSYISPNLGFFRDPRRIDTVWSSTTKPGFLVILVGGLHYHKEIVALLEVLRLGVSRAIILWWLRASAGLGLAGPTPGCQGGPGLASAKAISGSWPTAQASSAQTLVEGCGLVQDIWNPDAQNDDTLW